MSVDNFETVSFRVRKEDFKEFQRVASALYQAQRLKRPGVGVMAKTFLYVMTNQFKQLEQQTQAILKAQVAAGNASIEGAPNVQ